MAIASEEAKRVIPGRNGHDGPVHCLEPCRPEWQLIRSDPVLHCNSRRPSSRRLANPLPLRQSADTREY